MYAAKSRMKVSSNLTVKVLLKSDDKGLDLIETLAINSVRRCYYISVRRCYYIEESSSIIFISYSLREFLLLSCDLLLIQIVGLRRMDVDVA